MAFVCHRALIGRVPALKVEWYHAYGTYLLGRAIHARASGRIREYASLCRATRGVAKSVGRMAFPAAPAVERLLEAGIACVRAGADGRHADVIGPLRVALAAASEREFLVFTPFLKRQLGLAIGGDEGAALVAAGTTEATAQGWQDLAAGAQLVLPGT